MCASHGVLPTSVIKIAEEPKDHPITRKALPGFRVGDRLVVMRYAEITPESRKSRNA